MASEDFESTLANDVRRMALAGASDEVLQAFIDCRRRGDTDHAERVLNQSQQQSRPPRPALTPVEKLRVASLRQVVNAVDSSTLYSFIGIIWPITDEIPLDKRQLRRRHRAEPGACRAGAPAGQGREGCLSFTSQVICMVATRKRRRTWLRENRLRLARRVQQVRALLASLPSSSQNQFLYCAKASLAGLTPVKALRRGLVASVMTAAHGYLER